MSRKGLILTIIIAAALIALAVLIWGQYDSSNNSNETQAPDTSNQSPPNTKSTSQSSTSAAATITYSNSGFTPSSVSVNSGDSIAVKNDSDDVMEFASDDHPTHRKQPELNIGEIAPGESKTFTIDKKGAWGYHNHLNPTDTGSIVVN